MTEQPEWVELLTDERAKLRRRTGRLPGRSPGGHLAARVGLPRPSRTPSTNETGMTEQPQQPDWSKLTEAMKKLGAGLDKVGHGLTAQAALGRIMDGNEAKARELLAQLPVEYVKLLSLGARALADLADEDVSARG